MNASRASAAGWARVFVSVALVTSCHDAGQTPACEDDATPATTNDTDKDLCCGCLCADPTWSCAMDTCVGPDGTVAGLAPEAGFLEIEAHGYTAGGSEHVSTRMRMWYAFRPAHDAEPDTPLLVAFNGGPGAGTGILFGANTHDWTIDPSRTTAIGETARPWTAFAHVLYVDSPATGFSYGLAPAGDVWSSEHDASMLLHVALRFVARHPALAAAPIVPLGESWGGARATLMLEQARGWEALAEPTSAYGDLTLHEEIVAHGEALRPSCDEEAAPPDIVTRFPGMVSIQGALDGIGGLKADTREGCIADPDVYRCDRAPGGFDVALSAMLGRLREPATLSALTGVDVGTVAWMHADARAGALVRGEDNYASDESAMAAEFGSLPAGHRYYVGLTFDYARGLPLVGPMNVGDTNGIASRFVQLAASAEVLLTDARFDLVVDSSQLPAALENTGFLLGAAVDRAPREGIARPGWLVLQYDASLVETTSNPRRLRFPQYDAGHVVTLDQPDAFAEDLAAWLADL
jgi:hypothetical protein